MAAHLVSRRLCRATRSSGSGGTAVVPRCVGRGRVLQAHHPLLEHPKLVEPSLMRPNVRQAGTGDPVAELDDASSVLEELARTGRDRILEAARLFEDALGAGGKVI